MQTPSLIAMSSVVLSTFVASAVACSAGGGPEDPGASSGGAGYTTSSGGRQDIGTTGGSPIINPDAGGVVDPNDDRPIEPRQEVCDENGNCTCLRLALLGTLESAATDSDSSVFQAWLNNNSGGSAEVTIISTKPEITAEWLAQYDIILSANINTWTFSPAEKEAIANWVRTTGGGIVALTGFESTASEPAQTSQLIDWSGVRFTSQTTAPADGQNTPLYYQGGTTNLKDCLWWSERNSAGTTTAINILPQPGQLEKLTFSCDYVGAFIGWGVEGPEEAVPIASDPMSGATIAMAHQVDNMGRIFAFGDEWVIFANQWEPAGNPPNQTQDQYNVCYVMPENDPNGEGFFHSVQTLYQTKQFWYNAINWVAPPNECGFEIIDDYVEILY